MGTRISSADLITSAKCGNDWKETDLRAYNIRVVYQDVATFFQISSPTGRLPTPAVQHPAVLTLDDPASATDASESAVDDFAVLLLQELGYAPIGRVIRTRKNIPLTDLCIIDDGGILLLVHGDKRQGNPVPQLVAEAIAAFQSNNLTRDQELVAAVVGGVYLATESIVQAHLPAIPRPADRLNEGMKPGPQDNRLAIMSCYEAFKQFVH
ncbi:hypothetical protein C8F01DRAFT_1221249 [Mycena amicta]|nr:hypothetical protein C8F01DRAFT_1221249 [Mycena amicta]